jgi:L-ribulose-5-phosphate 3-epimerase
MDKPLVRASQAELEDRLNTFHWLLERGRLIGINRMVIPFVDASRIDTQAEFDGVVMLLQRVLSRPGKPGSRFTWKHPWPRARFAELLSRLPDPRLKVNYDSGNSSSLGYAPREEFAAYGERVGSVHIKDRLLGASTVPLGTGDADFLPWLKVLRKWPIKETSSCRWRAAPAGTKWPGPGRTAHLF